MDLEFRVRLLPVCCCCEFCGEYVVVCVFVYAFEKEKVLAGYERLAGLDKGLGCGLHYCAITATSLFDNRI